MKNTIIPLSEREAIRAQVEKIHKGLGNPEPPLRLQDVRELLELDTQYYSSTDDSAVREFVSKVRVGTKQVLKRPALIVDAIRKAKLAALWIPDKKRILLDRDQPQPKHRWHETHEVVHSQLPWHAAYTLGDSARELSQFCRDLIEAEANYGAGQLLFFMDEFTERARSLDLSLDAAFGLSKEFGNTMTSTLWRYVEEACFDVAAVALVTKHPFYPTGDIDPESPCRRCIESPPFKEQFGSIPELELYEHLADYCSRKRQGPLGAGEVILTDRNGDEHGFKFESFGIRHYVLTLAVCLRKHSLVVAVPR